MLYRVLAIPATGAPDLEEELNQFLRSHKVISVQKTVAIIDNAPRWCFCIEYLDGGKPSSVLDSGKGRRRGGERVDYKEVLCESDFAVYARLRDLRKEIATVDAIPVYAVCTNEQLAAMAQRRPSSLSDLKTIDGFGDAKAGKYGQSFLRVLAESEGEVFETSRVSD